jgi:hypothetical protein
MQIRASLWQFVPVSGGATVDQSAVTMLLNVVLVKTGVLQPANDVTTQNACQAIFSVIFFL